MDLTHPTYAQVTRTTDGWKIFVADPGIRLVAEWPEVEFSGAAIPTTFQREAAVTHMGYRIADGSEWAWQERQSGSDDPVELFGSVVVESLAAPVVTPDCLQAGL